MGACSVRTCQFPPTAHQAADVVRHCQKCNDTDFALFGNVRYISVTHISCFTTGAYGGSNSDLSTELTLYVNVLLTIYSPSTISLLATDIYSTGS